MSTRRIVLLAAFFLSGLAGLIFETVWTRLLLLSLGSTATAVGIVLGAFMGGMAIGSALAGGRRVARLDPVLAFAGLEAFIALYAVSSPWILGLVSGAALSFLALLPATIAMGASLPVLARALDEAETAAVGIGRLYAANTAGAVMGPLLAVFFLFPSFGLSSSLWIGAALDAAVFLIGVTLALSTRPAALTDETTESELPEEPGPIPGFESSPIPGFVLVAVAVSGASAMVYEVAWSRTLSMVYGSSVYGVSIMLSTFLLGIALGSAFAAAFIRRRPEGDKKLRLSRALIASASMAFVSLIVSRSLPFLFLNLYTSFEGESSALFVSQFVIAALFMLPCTMALGATLPFAIDAVPEIRDAGATVARIYSANLTGSALGALAASALLLASLGVEFSIRVAAIAVLALGLYILTRAEKFPVALAATTGSFILIILALDPSGARSLKTFGIYSGVRTYAKLDLSQLRATVAAHHLLYYRDGATATVAVAAIEPYKLLKINGKTDASNGPGDMQTQMLMGHMPFLVQGAKKVAVVGWGAGFTVDAVLKHPVERVDAYEIEPAVVEASKYFEPENGSPLKDERVNLVIGDARTELVKGEGLYDLIINEPSNPWLTGVSNLFTLNFFELAAERLKEDGVFCQWFHLYGMTEDSTRSLFNTFRQVFPHAIAFKDRDLIVLGSRKPIALSTDRLQAFYEDPAIRDGLIAAGLKYPSDVLVSMRLDEEGIEAFSKAAPLNTDDNMRIELSAPRSLYTDEIDSILETMGEHPPDVVAHLSEMSPEAEAATRLELAASYFTEGKLDFALEQAERAAALGSSFEAEKLRGQVLQQLGRSDEARVALESALAAGGDADGRRFVEAMLRSLGS